MGMSSRGHSGSRSRVFLLGRFVMLSFAVVTGHVTCTRPIHASGVKRLKLYVYGFSQNPAYSSVILELHSHVARFGAKLGPIALLQHLKALNC